MSIKKQIEHTFQGNAFSRPLFYTYQGGLRFQLSEEGSFIHQFLTAIKKANKICQSVFATQENVTVCLKFYGSLRLLPSIQIFRDLRELDIVIPGDSEHWSEQCDEDDTCSWHYLAFSVSKEYLSNFLWAACASDFGYIKPNPRVNVYLFNIEKEIIVFPYDDRGMDVVGNNHVFLRAVYSEFSNYLLECDVDTMKATFSSD